SAYPEGNGCTMEQSMYPSRQWSKDVMQPRTYCMQDSREWPRQRMWAKWGLREDAANLVTSIVAELLTVGCGTA
ncbi:MAG: hypothetical protein M1456_02550, partial [Actinobacteria bacterium]|nr:hypothetical protein [Actinomycetota bacterium]